MPINRDAILSATVDSEACHYDERASMLYALAVGFAGVEEAAELRFVSDVEPVHTVPTLANGLIDDAFIGSVVPNAAGLRHVGERVDLYRPLPPGAKLLANRRVVSLADRGGDHGLEIEVESELRLARDDTVLATCWRSYLAASEWGGDAEPARRLHSLPDRDPDLVCTIETPANQALLFGLLESMSDASGSTERPRAPGRDARELQPLCVHGIACRAILRTICNYDFTLIDGFEARFTATARAGESVSTDMWQDGNVVSFRCRNTDTDAVIIDHGRCTLSA